MSSIGERPVTGAAAGSVSSVNLSQIAGNAVQATPASHGQLAVTIYDSSGNEILSSTPVQVDGTGLLATYSANVTGLVAVASATDIFTITGSASKTVRIRRIGVSGIATAAISAIVQLTKRSTANTAGTSGAATAVSHDSTNAAATATVLSYTANPTTGTLVGAIRSAYLGLSGTSGLIGGSVQEWIFSTAYDQSVTLRGVAQVLAINLNGVTVTGGNFNCWVEWTEE